jgi:hypothetical protein
MEVMELPLRSVVFLLVRVDTAVVVVGLLQQLKVDLVLLLEQWHPKVVGAAAVIRDTEEKEVNKDLVLAAKCHRQ